MALRQFGPLRLSAIYMRSQRKATIFQLLTEQSIEVHEFPSCVNEGILDFSSHC